MKRKRGQPIDLLAELTALRELEHKRLAKAEFRYFEALRAEEAEKKRRRLKEAKGD